MRIGFALPAHTAAILSTEAVRFGHQVVFVARNRTELELELDSVAVDAIVAAASGGWVDPDMQQVLDGMGVVLVTVIVDPRDPFTARVDSRAIGLGASWEAIEPLLSGTSLGDKRSDGKVVVVWGAAGSPGRSTVAASLAACIPTLKSATRGDELGHSGPGQVPSTLLVDADSHAPSLALALGVQEESAGIAAACRLAAMDALDRSELLRLSRPVAGTQGKAMILTGLVRSDRWPELAEDRVVGACRAATQVFEVTVLDVAAATSRDEEIVSDFQGPRRNAATLAALSVADVVVLVGAADPVGVARMIEAAAVIPELTNAPVVPVLNRVRADASVGLGLSAQTVDVLARLGEIRNPILLPMDQTAADRALRNAVAVPIAAPRSRLAAAMRRLAATVLSVACPI